MGALNNHQSHRNLNGSVQLIVACCAFERNFALFLRCIISLHRQRIKLTWIGSALAELANIFARKKWPLLDREYLVVFSIVQCLSFTMRFCFSSLAIQSCVVGQAIRQNCATALAELPRRSACFEFKNNKILRLFLLPRQFWKELTCFGKARGG